MAIPFYDGKGRAKLPNYTYRTKSEQLSKLKKFLADVENFSYIYETENEEAGKNYLLGKKDQVNLDYVRENATEKLQALLDIAEEEMTPEDVLDTLFIASDPVPGPGVDENSLLLIPVRTIETDLHQFKGKVNTKNYKDIYKTMITKLSEEEIQEAHDTLDGDIIDDKLYQEPHADYWQAVIDEDKLKEQLVLRLQTNEKDLEERHPAAAALVKVLGRLTVS